MTPRYEEAGKQIGPVAKRLIEKNHPHLIEAKVKFLFLFAFSTEEDEPAMKEHGQTIAGYVEKIKPEHRAAGLGAVDVLMVIDGDRWPEWPEESRDALIDHELQHVQIVPDKKRGGHKKEIDGRPKIRMLNHDFEIHGFDAVVERHGKAAFEALYLAKVATSHSNTFKQLTLGEWG